MYVKTVSLMIEISDGISVFTRSCGLVVVSLLSDAAPGFSAKGNRARRTQTCAERAAGVDACMQPSAEVNRSGARKGTLLDRA